MYPDVYKRQGKEPNKSLNPDECVAVGASIQGGKLAGDAGAADIITIWAQSAVPGRHHIITHALSLIHI